MTDQDFRNFRVRRLDLLIQRGKSLLTPREYSGQIDHHDLWYTEARSFLRINAPTFSDKMNSIAPKYKDKLIEPGNYRAYYEVIQQQIEVLKEVRGIFEELAEKPRGWMMVRPNPYLLRRTDFKKNDETLLTVFVVIWWDLLDNIYKKIKEVLEGTGDYFVTCAGERQGQVVFEDIWKLMNESDVVLVDFTGRRPNVYLEYGMALVLGKPIVAITQNKDDMPSDTPNLKYSLYKNDLGEKFFNESLSKQIKDTISDFKEIDH